MSRGRIAGGLGLLLAGYVVGSVMPLIATTATAQQPAAPQLPDATVSRIREANDALKVAMEALKTDSLYVAATKSLNSLAVLGGGVNAIDDLEAGRGVDPVTFAGLYAGDAVDEVKDHLGFDAEGRVTYKNKVVRLYPISRLKKFYAQRMVVLGEIDADGAP